MGAVGISSVKNPTKANSEQSEDIPNFRDPDSRSRGKTTGLIETAGLPHTKYGQ